MPEITNENLYIAAQEAYDLLQNSKVKFADYALAYLAAMLDKDKMELAAKFASTTIEKALAVQCLYVLSNLEYWRGQDARRLKKIFKAYAKQHS